MKERHAAMIDCILCGRVSTDKQDMQRQERMFADYCHRNALQPVLTLLDEDTSGSIPFREREHGGRLLAEITQHVSLSVNLAIVTTEQDRIGRDTLDIIATIRAIWQLGAVPHFIAEGGALPRSPENELRMEIKASVAQYERNKIRQRIQSKLDGKRAHGELCGTLSYGWNVASRYNRHDDYRDHRGYDHRRNNGWEDRGHGQQGRGPERSGRR
jgi:putative DNA-invertase from lambdoid prophage Rac